MKRKKMQVEGEGGKASVVFFLFLLSSCLSRFLLVLVASLLLLLGPLPLLVGLPAGDLLLQFHSYDGKKKIKVQQRHSVSRKKRVRLLNFKITCNFPYEMDFFLHDKSSCVLVAHEMSASHKKL